MLRSLVQLIPDEIAYENLDPINGQHIELPPDVRNALLRRGHKLVPTNFGSVCQVRRDYSTAQQGLSFVHWQLEFGLRVHEGPLVSSLRKC